VFVALVIGLAGACSNSSTATQSSPKPSPVQDYGPPPAGVPLIYVQNPAHSTWLVGFDWSGKPRGTIKLSQPIDPQRRMIQTPDGSGFAYDIGGKGGNLLFLDRLGNPIPNQDSTPRYHDQMWADDAKHLCTLESAVDQWTIGVRTPGAAPVSPQVVALDSPNLRSGIIAITFAACSPANDRAVLQYSYFPRPAEFWVVRLSDGKILGHRSYALGQFANVAASPDAALLAANSGTSAGQIEPAAPSTIISRASDLSVVSTLAPTEGVIGFNSDDSLALVNTTPWAAGVATQLAVVDIRTGTVISRYADGRELSGFLALPGGRDFALLFQSPSDSKSPPAVDIVIAHADGTSTAVPGHFIRL
jgi:hypothetical protein